MPIINLSASDTTFVSRLQPDCNFNGLNYLEIANNPPSSNQQVGLMKFALPACLKDVAILHASLYLYIASSCSMPSHFSRQLTLFKNISDFNACAVTWLSRPSPFHYPSGMISIGKADYLKYICCDIKPLVLEWLRADGSNNGLSLTIPPHYLNNALTIETNCGEHPPVIVIEYQPKQPPSSDECCDDGLQRLFIDETFCLSDTKPIVFSPVIDTSHARSITFFVQNLGLYPVTASLQISPDGKLFIPDPQQIVLTDQDPGVLTPYRFARYTRVMINNTGPAGLTNVRVWYQAQLINNKPNCQS